MQAERERERRLSLTQQIAQHCANVDAITEARKNSTYANPDDDPTMIALLDRIEAQTSSRRVNARKA